ncbi:putative GTP-binding protein 6 isoform X1 [Anabrus simplex]|uniref:putative GTP-binding protein 6 isoform X1 n=1 Tax=Anabrus simplex TaxID=316456 RepID=UPI0035A3A26F
MNSVVMCTARSTLKSYVLIFKMHHISSRLSFYFCDSYISFISTLSFKRILLNEQNKCLSCNYRNVSSDGFTYRSSLLASIMPSIKGSVYLKCGIPNSYNKYFLSSNKWSRHNGNLNYGRYLTSTSCCYKSKSAEDSEHFFDSGTLENCDTEYEDLARQWLRLSSVGHQLLVIQPYIKWGAGKKHNTTPELQLAEAVALANSIPKWAVVDKMVISMKSFEKKTFFGSGNYEMLKEKIRKDKSVTAVFISTQMLRGMQHRELETGFGVPVFDRYAVVMQILRERAVTREAKLQVAMAEIPYLRSRLRDVEAGSLDKRGGTGGAIGGPGETYLEIQKRSLTARENKLKQMLLKLREQRDLLRNKRKKLEYPVVAVVGYTNAGKTSLIRALTGNLELKPEDKLFATLDVTMHLGSLPCSLKLLYVDTIGFISDIPTHLIESFVATLEDAVLADVILHVRDISHPDTIAQADNVMTTLQGLNLSPEILQNIVVAGNKADLVSDGTWVSDNNYIPVSATQHTGLDQLVKVIEETVLKVTGRHCIVIRVPMGGPESRWLYKQAAVTEAVADPGDNQYLLMKVVISEAQLSKFRSYFG